MSRLLAEYRVFASAPQEMRALLITNSIYALVLPVIEVFVAAYVLRDSHQASKVIVYQLCIYTMIPVAFFCNGFLLRVIAMNYLYAMGMVLSGVSLVVLMTASIRTTFGIAVCGGVMGLATGFFWANRGFLVVSTTTDSNRNYFYGLETSVVTITSVLVPLGVGALISFEAKHHTHGLSRGYRDVAFLSLLLTALASIVILRERFNHAGNERFVFFRFHPRWLRLLLLAALRGLGQGYILTAPALLVLRFVGQEGTLGRLEAVGSCVAAVVLYVIGRSSQPQHRVHVLAMALLLFLTGAASNAILFDRVGVLIFMACLLLAKPLIDLAYYPIQLRVLEDVSRLEGRSPYAYILSQEYGVYVGRFIGCGLFLLVAFCLSDVVALRYALLMVALLQLPAIGIARRLQA